jgi:His/Glu/Gln/Arg/opine family amino acid ABC transporter permease subunit
MGTPVNPPAPLGATSPPEPRNVPAVRFFRRFITRRLILRLSVGVLGAVLAFAVVIWLGQRGFYNLAYAASVYPALLAGFYVSVELVIFIIPLGFALGLLIGWARTSHSVILRGFGGLYVDFFRSLPPIGLIVFASLLGTLALKPYILNPYLLRNVALWLGATALAFHTGAYQAEIVRAGILSVPAGQTEAASAVGMSRARMMFVVTLPQAFRVSLPALGNEFSSVIKDSSLLNIIGWFELTGIALVQIYAGIRVSIYAPLIIWFEVAAFYFILTFALNVVVRAVEETYKVPGLEAASVW